MLFNVTFKSKKSESKTESRCDCSFVNCFIKIEEISGVQLFDNLVIELIELRKKRKTLAIKE